MWGGDTGVGTPTYQGGPDLQGLLTKMPIADTVPGIGVTEWGAKSDQPPDSLFAHPRAGYSYDPGGV